MSLCKISRACLWLLCNFVKTFSKLCGEWFWGLIFLWFYSFCFDFSFGLMFFVPFISALWSQVNKWSYWKFTGGINQHIRAGSDSLSHPLIITYSSTDLICHVINHNNAMSSSVVTGCDGAEAFLTSRVPLRSQSRHSESTHTHTYTNTHI